MTDDVVRTMPAIRAGFEALKEMLRDGRMNDAAARLFGDSVLWGEELKEIYAGDDRERLADRDPLTRFFVCRLRGMPSPGEIADAPAQAAFLMAFTAFPYLDAMVEEVSVGEHVGFDEDGAWIVHRILAGEPDGVLKAEKSALLAWSFDLMPLYMGKAAALEAFIAAEFGGDFDAFLTRYVAEHDLPFDMDRAWRPLAA